MLTTFSTNRTVNKVDLLPRLILPGGFNTDVIGAAANFLKGPAMEFPIIPQSYASEGNFSSGPIGPSSPGYVQGTANTVVQGPSTPQNQKAYQQAVSNNTAPSSSGGGGGTGLDPHINPATGQWDDNYFASQFQNDQAETNRLIDEAYGASAGYLNQAESMLRGDYPTVLSEIETQRANAQKLAESGKTSTLGSIGEQQTLATQRNQNVMADARRLYDELRRGYGQRFGGASSAGQAATELGNLEQQRQQGRTQQDFGNTLRQIEQARTQVETKFQEQVMQLEQTKQSAVNEANRDFQSKLLQIQQSRAENEQMKAQARLSALQDLRNKVYQINLQNLQFQQTLQAQKQQAELGLKSYSDELSGFGAQAETAGQGYNPSITSNLQTSGVQGASTTNPYLGAITQQPNRKDDFLSGLGFSLYQ